MGLDSTRRVAKIAGLRAAGLDDAERAHLLRLAHEADGSNAILRPRRRPKQWTIRPSLQWSLNTIIAPAILSNNRMFAVKGQPAPIQAGHRCPWSGCTRG